MSVPVRIEPSEKNARNSSLIFLQGCFNSRLTVKLHTSLVETSNSEAGTGRDAVRKTCLGMMMVLEQRDERPSCWEKGATPEWPGHSHYVHVETFHHQQHLEKAVFDGVLLPAFLGLQPMTQLYHFLHLYGFRARAQWDRRQIFSLESPEQFSFSLG